MGRRHSLAISFVKLLMVADAPPGKALAVILASFYVLFAE
jgi:hypothetical protein